MQKEEATACFPDAGAGLQLHENPFEPNIAASKRIQLGPLEANPNDQEEALVGDSGIIFALLHVLTLF